MAKRPRIKIVSETLQGTSSQVGNIPDPPKETGLIAGPRSDGANSGDRPSNVTRVPSTNSGPSRNIAQNIQPEATTDKIYDTKVGNRVSPNRFLRFVRSPIGIVAILCLLGAAAVGIYTWAQVRVIPKVPAPINFGPGCYSSAGCGNAKPQSAPAIGGTLHQSALENSALSKEIALAKVFPQGASREPGVPTSSRMFQKAQLVGGMLGHTASQPSSPGLTSTSNTRTDSLAQSVDPASSPSVSPTTTQPQLPLPLAASQPASQVPVPTTQAALDQLPLITPSPQPAFAQDAPDPDVFVYRGVYYALTTGTVWGNSIGSLECYSKLCPYSGWVTADGNAYGSSALPHLPSWEEANTQTSPGTIDLSGVWTMYYDAVDNSNGHYCISVATSLSPQGPYQDSSAGPLICQIAYGGSIDPQPFLDPSGQLWLDWKTNDGSSIQPAWIWAQQLSPNGRSLQGQATQILFQDMVNHPWEATIENPDMIFNSGTYYLFFSGGLWDSPGYGQGYAICSGPSGPCSEPQEGPILFQYSSNLVPGGQVAGPGGGMAFYDPAQKEWFFAYAAWNATCTSYACGGARQLYIGALNFQ